MAYTIDTNDLTDYNVQVSESEGLLDFLKRKRIDRFDFFDSDGEQSYTDSEDITFEPRKLTLKCSIVETQANYLTDLAALLAILEATGLRTLVAPYSVKEYECYLADGTEFKRLTKTDSLIRSSSFNLILTEPVPDDGLLGGDVQPAIGTPSERIRIDTYDLDRLYGIQVQRSSGYDSYLKQKKFPVYSHPFETGIPYYQATADKHYKARTIILDCFMKAVDIATLVTNLRLFKGMLYASGLRTLYIDGDNYSVYAKDGAKVKFVNAYNRIPIIKFRLKLREPAP